MHPHPPAETAPLATPAPWLEWPVPEILAPAGGRAQFFAALQAGADAVFLGLKNFNARGRAENFSLDDLRELLPLARQAGMRVLVTLNILIKEAELPQLIEELSALQSLGIEAVIVQDLGVARLIRSQFPHMRMHASTQLAVHNKAGVLAAAELGFRRVVLARELTAQEIRRIRREVPRELIEIEAFCHGSLCYSYSGLCFFSGAEDARSGNRGECAYTCRKPYQILNEPGHGFLFSMKDLDTSLDLEKLVAAGVDTLKIEGRKKDAQYVATTVGLYRQQLNQLFGRETGRLPIAPLRDFRRDMAFSFHRDTTSFFVKGRYHENVIDLNNPTHRGQRLGTVISVEGRTIEVVSSEALERFDGLRIDRPEALYHAKPQHGLEVKASPRLAQKKYDNEDLQFSLREFWVDGKKVNAAAPGARVRIQLPDSCPLPRMGDSIFKVRSNELKRHTDHLAQAPQGSRLRRLEWVDLHIAIEGVEEQLHLSASAHLGKRRIATHRLELKAQRPERGSSLERDLRGLFHIFGEAALETKLTLSGDTDWFVARSSLKAWKQQLQELMSEGLQRARSASQKEGLEWVRRKRRPLPSQEAATTYQIKFDRLEYLPALARFLGSEADFHCSELIFEPKRAFLHQEKGDELWRRLFAFSDTHGLTLRFALPTVIRAWDEPLLRAWINAFTEQGGRAFEVGNVGAIHWLKTLGHQLEKLDLSSDFTLYALNTEAALSLSEAGVGRFALSVEDDRASIEDKLENWPEGLAAPQVILFKDTPLFIAEACSLTALHHGCPGSQTCGYRTLEIANEKGERFFVAHETCKSIVYGAEAFSWTQHKDALELAGIHSFRIDLLTRLYSDDDLQDILRAAYRGEAFQGTQSANFSRELL